MDESLLIRDNSLTTSIVKSGDKPREAEEVAPDLAEAARKPPAPDWSPLQLSSYNLSQPPPARPEVRPEVRPKPSLRTETLERHPVRRPSLRTFTSGRASAEPLDSHRLTSVTSGTSGPTNLVSALPSSLSELDLR